MKETKRLMIERCLRDLECKLSIIDIYRSDAYELTKKIEEILQDDRENDIKNFLPKEVLNVHERVL